MRQEYGRAECPTCATEFSRLPVEYDGDMAMAVLETKPCPYCFVPLCVCCDAKHCQDCGDFVCSSHIVIVPDGTPKPLELCPACAAEALQQELEFQPATYKACPQCQGTKFQVQQFHGYISLVTGYDDSGERFVCECGFEGDTEELLNLPEAELPERMEPARETAKPGETRKVA